MSSILIVDDEYFIVQGIVNNTDWKKLGIDTIHTAYSVEQAKKIYLDESVDLLLADVEMPRETGLDLIRWINENHYSSINILLTGHANFDYAQTAIGLQVFRYVLKPAPIDVLTETIAEALEKFRYIKEKKETASRLLLSAFWNDLCSGVISPSPDAVNEYLNCKSIDESALSENYFFGYLKASPRNGIVSSNPRDALDFNELESIFYHQYSEMCYLTDTDDQGYVVCISSDADMSPEIIDSGFDTLANSMAEHFPDYIFVVYYFAEEPLYSASYAYEFLRQYSAQVITCRSCAVSVLTQPVADSNDELKPVFNEETLRKWGEWLAKGRAEDAMLELRHQLYNKDTVYSSRYFISAYYSLLRMLFSLCTERKIPTEEIIQSSANPSNFTHITAAAENLLVWANQIFCVVSDCISRQETSGSAIDIMRKYIRENLSNPDMNRDSIADAVHMSPDYLSYFFHKETGGVLSSYINEERIALARKLLASTDMSLSIVASSCGFANDTYFHKQFKKITGQTPSDYRGGFRKGIKS